MMQDVSYTYELIKGALDKRYETKVIIDGVGTFYEDSLFSVKTGLQMFENAPEIGKAVAGEVDIKMINPVKEVPTMARVRLFVRACGTIDRPSAISINGEELTCSIATISGEDITFPEESGATIVGEELYFTPDETVYAESEWLPQGVYYVDTHTVAKNYKGVDVLTIHGFDAMLTAEADYDSNDAVGDDYDTAFVRAIAAKMGRKRQGIEVDERTWDVMGGGHIITSPIGYSMREILGLIASIYVGCFIITDAGKLRLVSLLELPAETNLLIDNLGDAISFGIDEETGEDVTILI